ncbi:MULTISPECIES: SDR family NAD(P)-dependent oxidoreductase [unclassified Lentimonas]|uniref:SDR family NAD(P)-dependent oxidoreductase n=1 Tax=unclassified Lentimonas TaxID=2630993 RepID=UPI00132AA612|nr:MULTISPECIES: SDR family NAD(P)-dependent oxidoreductase [unclassified Lentimonas]CAA6678748.1 3-oxoacyl-[acyl-carrier protein] reductase (EC [Lentimonas sp. CC4]CAA6683734.1 3-oxoacyl-[acyl-carrier protein] reductase (EC [Lentimonas sp. CC6]CAA7074418.1 3-oxoacyl-[acyl-carrier protein] reductase (EC [Lentimonas sp. CC4]CAA7169028.1 3-oxoacyl-[acyl-carrier protein] reductase (EC [Lentimonas sp. CC21]CAA7180565.1 3-oxoacyl-[acyl-carrier protein] reductase (EC [Lentimonas sp. CC8]
MKPKVLVTGATRGIGRAIAARLLKDGYAVYGTGTNRSAARCADLPDLVGVSWLDVDFSDRASVRVFLTALAGLGPFDGLVNNAGVNRIKPLDEVDEADYDFVHDTNLRSPYLVCREVIKGMEQIGGGRIVNIASIWSVITKAHRSLYSSAKTGLVGLTRALAVEAGPKGVLVNTVSPGFVMTDMTRESLSEAEIAALEAQVPMRKMAAPEDIADVVRFLLSQENRYLTGQNIIVDGGFTNV